jgi:tetratricopeptide (TPR) repeat protein
MAVQQAAQGATAVQIVGDYNEVTVGVVPLILDRRHRWTRPPTTELELLQTQFRAVTLRGRENDLSRLRAWLDSSRAVSARCVTGRAGTGKTRLAIELCEQAEAVCWLAGFADHDELARIYQAHGLNAWQWHDNTLMVVDYAAAATKLLRAWLESLARRDLPDGGPKLRLLLLERHADSNLGWWRDLLRGGGMSGPGPDTLFDPPDPEVLQPLGNVEHRRALLADVMRQASRLRGAPIVAPPPPDTDPDFDRRLDDDSIGNEPLYLAMAGLVAIASGAAAALTLTQSALAERVADAERQRLARWAEATGIDPLSATHMAACVTLRGGATREAARALVEQECRAMQFPPASPDRVVAWLTDALPGPAASAAPITPDLLGEAFVVAEFASNGRTLAEQAAIVQRAWRHAGQAVLRSITRTAQDFALWTPDHASVAWLDRIAAEIDDPEQLGMIVADLPDRSVALAERTAALEARLVASLMQRTAPGADEVARLARALLDLSARLRTLGRQTDALALAEKAVDRFRYLVSAGHNMSFELPWAIGKLAQHLADAGRGEEAIEAGEESLRMWRSLFEAGDHRAAALLAGALSNQASRVAQAGRLTDALAMDEEALSYSRILHGADHVGGRDLGILLNNFSNHLAQTGRDTDALDAAAEAKEILAKEAARQPDAHLPDLMLALMTLANRFRDAERRREAIAAGEQMLRHVRILAQRNPAVFSIYLWHALFNLAADQLVLSAAEPSDEDGRLQAAVAYGEEAAQLGREQVQLGQSSTRLVGTLGVLAAAYRNTDRHEEALAVLVDGIKLLSPVFGQQPAHEGTARTLIGSYLTQCELMRREPDTALLAPLLPESEAQTQNKEATTC